MKHYLETYPDMPMRELTRRVHARIVRYNRYMGIKCTKNPMDMWVYQEIIYETKPNVLVEIGTGSGGSALAFAHLLEHTGGRVISMDIVQKAPETVSGHKKIHLLKGDACELFPKVRQLILPWETVMVIEDSSHEYDNTLKVLNVYSSLVRSGYYFVVEDTDCHHGINRGPSPGPYEAVEAFLKSDPSFEADREREPFFLTSNPKGFLRRK